mmetsp:Transcript_43214/g.105762  ORF Transcript_43214/g.105762 Transcript_43214/m.105762 type:complete len:210 (+) Transcript_43214:1263-1892(+)
MPAQGQRRACACARGASERAVDGAERARLRGDDAHLSEPGLPQREDLAGHDAGAGAGEVHGAAAAAPGSDGGSQLANRQRGLRVLAEQQREAQPPGAHGRCTGHPRICGAAARATAEGHACGPGQGFLLKLHGGVHWGSGLHLAHSRQAAPYAHPRAGRQRDSERAHGPPLPDVLVRSRGPDGRVRALPPSLRRVCLCDCFRLNESAFI